MKNFEEIKKYETLNSISKKGGAVFFGGTYLSEIPVCELAEDYGLDMPVYNRSIKDITVKDAQEVFETCIVPLRPQKVFMSIGESDIINGTKTDEFIADYEWLLYTLNVKCRCKIYVLSVSGESQQVEEANRRLKQMCEVHKCEFIDLNRHREPTYFFDKIRFYMRSCPISFAEAMNS